MINKVSLLGLKNHTIMRYFDQYGDDDVIFSYE